MSEIKQRHVVAKTLWQIFLVFIELLIAVGITTYISNKFYPSENWIELIERIGVFYGIYQIVVYIILSTINDVKADEYLALKNNASIALKACEYNDEEWKNIIKAQIDKQLNNSILNDLLVRQNYSVLKTCIDTNTTKNIEYMIIWAEHCAEMSKLQWRFSFLLRVLK